MTFMWYVIALPLSILAAVWFFAKGKPKPQARIYPFPERYVTREEVEQAFETIAQETQKVVEELLKREGEK